MRTINPHAKQLRRNMTDAEKLLWQRLRNRQLDGCKFRRQSSIGPFVADFACIEAKLVVEADGGQHSESDTDERRTRFLQSKGWRVLRFWNNDILSNIDGVLEVIASELPQRPSSSGG